MGTVIHFRLRLELAVGWVVVLRRIFDSRRFVYLPKDSEIRRAVADFFAAGFLQIAAIAAGCFADSEIVIAAVDFAPESSGSAPSSGSDFVTVVPDFADFAGSEIGSVGFCRSSGSCSFAVAATEAAELDLAFCFSAARSFSRSEERRVGKECR